ncbi:hypothetical protein IFR05_002407 [Cadophora sp. M221]|nr:hypothetical protein IFR05_002407 [Cadophora sp. M221]
MSSSIPSLDLLQKIKPHPIFDTEIATTIPITGTGAAFTDRQALLLLRLSLIERHKRASDIWDTKGRAKKLRKDWYAAITGEELGSVGLALGQPSLRMGTRRYVNAGSVGSQGGVGAGEESEEDSRGDEGEEGSSPQPRLVRDLGRDEEVVDGEVGPEYVRGADLALALFGSEVNAKIDEDGMMKVSVVWLHDMDGSLAKRVVKGVTYCGDCMMLPEGEDEDEDEEEDEDHFADILLDTNNITLSKFLRQLDNAVTEAFPDAAWNNMQLDLVEFGGWMENNEWKSMLREKFGDELSEEQVEEMSADLEFTQVFVGYEFVSKDTARAARMAWAADL